MSLTQERALQIVKEQLQELENRGKRFLVVIFTPNDDNNGLLLQRTSCRFPNDLYPEATRLLEENIERALQPPPIAPLKMSDRFMTVTEPKEEPKNEEPQENSNVV